MERRADNQVVLDNTYIPPTLHVGGDATMTACARSARGGCTSAR